MPRKVIDDTVAFQELIEKMTFYHDIVHTNQPFLRENPTRTQQIHDELSASPLNAVNTPLPGTQQDPMENLNNIEAFCIKQPEGVDDRIRLVFVGMGALALLMRKEGLSAVRKSQAIKLVGERMNAKYFASEIQHMQDTHLHSPFPTFNHSPTVENPSRDTEPYQCTLEEAVDLVRRNPFSVIERLCGVGVEKDLNLTWRVMGVSIGRGRKIFDLEFGMDVSSMEVDEDTFIALISKTRDVYMPMPLD